MDYIFAMYSEETVKAIKDQRYDSPLVVRLLKGDGDSYQNKWPPVMFPPGKVGDRRESYKSEVLINVRAIFSLVFAYYSIWQSDTLCCRLRALICSAAVAYAMELTLIPRPMSRG